MQSCSSTFTSGSEGQTRILIEMYKTLCTYAIFTQQVAMKHAHFVHTVNIFSSFVPRKRRQSAVVFLKIRCDLALVTQTIG